MDNKGSGAIGRYNYLIRSAISIGQPLFGWEATSTGLTGSSRGLYAANRH